MLTAIGLSPGGSSTVHIYTQTIHRTTQNKQYLEQHNNLGECGPCPVLASYTLAFALQLRKKYRKTSVRVDNKVLHIPILGGSSHVQNTSMFLVSLPLLSKTTYKKFLCGAVDQKPPRIGKHLYPPQHQRDADLVSAAPAKTKSQRFSGERKTSACRKGEGEN